MPSGQLMTMPVLIVNMGGEMVYILEQRLQAQKIPEAKGQKVLNDVVRTMYYPRFVEELFKPQEMYSIQSTRQIFDRLAHSSIMRLNESSMDKLFDLMAMGFKYQIISCISPSEMIDVTSNHLDVLRRLVGETPQVGELVEDCIKQVQASYGKMSLADFNALRQSLCTFFQDRKIKVSLFLHDHLQNSDGSLVVPSGGVLPGGTLPPGTLRYFSGGAESGRDLLPVASQSAWKVGSGARTSLGSNVYSKESSGPSAAPASTPEAAAAGRAEPPAPTSPTSPSDSAKTAAAVGELNLLASLIGASPAPAQDTFKLEALFGGHVFLKESQSKSAGVEVIQIDGGASSHRKDLDSVRKQLESLEGQGGGTGNDGDDDLLDLLDQA